MRALAVDPGGTIGWVLADVVPLDTEGLMVDPKLNIRGWGEETEHQKFLSLIWEQIEDGEIDQLIIENFYPTGGVKSWQPHALHQIGALQWMSHYMGAAVAMQSPGDRKFATAEKLAPYPEVKGKGGHAKSALAHLVTWRWKEASHGR